MRNIELDIRMIESKTEMLYRQIKDKIELGIYVPQSNLPSEFQLCEEYKVSRITVRRAIKLLLEDDIIYRKESRGRLIVKAPETNKTIAPSSGDIGILIYRNDMIEHPYMNKFLSGAIKECEENDIRYRIFSLQNRNNGENELDYIIRFTKEHNLDGLLINCRLADQTLAALYNAHIKTVLFKAFLPGCNIPYVLVGHDAACLMYKHFLKLGHKKIAYISGPWDERVINESIFLIKQLCSYNNISFDPGLIFESGYKKEKIPHIIAHLVKSNVNAIIVDDDILALGAIAECKRLGLRVPEDIAIAGTNDLIVNSSFSPQLTSVYQPIADAGAKASDILLKLIRNEEVKDLAIAFAGKLDIRESCGAQLKIKTKSMTENELEAIES